TRRDFHRLRVEITRVNEQLAASMRDPKGRYIHMIARAIEKMIRFYEGSVHDIEHFLKVWGYARTIGELEALDPYTQETLELAAIVHDIACPLCRVKYGSTAGPYQQTEGIPLAREFYAEFGLPEEQAERICYLVGHHHTFHDIQGLDYQILVEADFLVNASESQMNQSTIENFKKNVFKTETGHKLLSEIYRLEQ
ncbi:MAG: HD domain-containing protein, partial [Lachnospiraceae bacterium]|nr:HD domain-containing protein [Lachnospiraceae bacterium]